MKNVEHGTLLMKGSWFGSSEYGVPDKMFFRATYAAAKFGQIDEAIRRFGQAVRESFGLEGEVSNGVENGNGVH